MLIGKKLIFANEITITTARMCVKILGILVMHVVKHIELVKKTSNLWYTKIKDEYGEKEVLERIKNIFDRNFESSYPEVYWKHIANLKENTHDEIWIQQSCIVTFLK